MKYTYKVELEGHDTLCYLHLIIDRVMFSGKYYDGHPNITPEIADFFNNLKTVKGVCDDYMYLNAYLLTLKICPFNIANTVSILIKRIQRRFASPFEGRQKVAINDMKANAMALNITRELQARDLMIEVAKLFPNQDPIRLAAGVKDLNLPPNETLEVLRGLSLQFKGENADPVRLVAGYKSILGLFPSIPN